MIDKEMKISDEYIFDIKTAEKILKDNGCTEMYIFGSVAENKTVENSDIDIAVKGIPKSKFFNTYGKIISSINHPVDLVCLDYKNEFTDFLSKNEDMIRVF